MTRSPDIDELRKRRQLNVQQQNLLEEDAIRKSATWFRTHLHEVPAPIRSFLAAHGIDLQSAVDVEFSDLRDVGLSGFYRGLVVTADARFWRWELLLDDAHSAIESVEEWRDVTSEHRPDDHVRGTGRNYASLCLTVLRELNAGD